MDNEADSSATEIDIVVCLVSPYLVGELEILYECPSPHSVKEGTTSRRLSV